jgi:hypothetical protein
MVKELTPMLGLEKVLVVQWLARKKRHPSDWEASSRKFFDKGYWLK